MRLFFQKFNKGFTFIEIIVTIAIIGIIAAFIIGNIANVKQRGRDGKRKSDLSLVQAALEQYKADYDLYPCFGGSDCNGINPGWGDLSTINNVDANDFPTKYLNAIPKDPLYSGGCGAQAPQYMYWHSATRQQYAIFAKLENANDSDAAAVKPQPPNQSFGACTGTGGKCTQMTVTFAGACQGAVYDYWVTNP